nr:hypothetical protein [uncultured Draconibacterium sp.]
MKIDFDNYPELGTLFSDYIVYLETSDPEKTHEIINDDIKTRLVDPKNQSIIRQPAQFYVLNKAQDYKKLPPAFSPYLRIYDNINYHIDFFKKYRKLIDKL